MSQKPPPEGARWAIPDWTPDASAHEQEVVQYLDQLEILRQDLARKEESGRSKDAEIAELKKLLKKEKSIPKRKDSERFDIIIGGLDEENTEFEIVEWTKAVGDVVTRGQTILKFKSNDVLFNLFSPHTGVISDLLCSEGDILSDGDVCGKIERLTLESSLENEIEIQREKIKQLEYDLHDASYFQGVLKNKNEELEKALAEKNKAPTMLRKFFISSGAIATSVSLIYSIYSIGSWGWVWITAPPPINQGDKIQAAAMQCAAKQRVTALGFDATSLDPIDQVRAPPSGIKSAPSTFLPVAAAADPDKWAGVTMTGLTLDANRAGWFDSRKDLRIKGTITNSSGRQITGLNGRWHIVAIDPKDLSCINISTDSFLQSFELDSGNSTFYDLKIADSVEIPPNLPRDADIKYFVSINPVLADF